MAEELGNKREYKLSGWPMIIGWIAMLIFALHASTHMVGAGDTWVALACGRHFFNHGVDTVEPFSANSHEAGPNEQTMEKYANFLRSSLKDPEVKNSLNGRLTGWWLGKVESYPDWSEGTKGFVKKVHPTGWVNQNWLTHVIFYWLSHESPFADAEQLSFNTLVYWKFAIYILTIIAVYYSCRALKVNEALSVVFACFALFVGRSFFDVRPAGFSNVLVAAFLLLLILGTYKNILYLWLIVPLTVFWCNLHGGYIYVFIMLAAYFGINLVTFFTKNVFVSIGKRGLYHTAAVGVVTFLATIVFNPFHLTNLTHTFIVSVSKHAKMWRSINEWHPAFEWSNPVGTGIPFLIMYILGWILLVSWILILLATHSYAKNKLRPKKFAESENYKWPKMNISLIIIAALTIYMAIRSRRFIAIAGIAACPVLAMFLQHIIESVSATRNLKRNGVLRVLPMTSGCRKVCIIAGVISVIFFGSWWGSKFKRVYLDPWPTDPKLNSVFMRMTASDAKPFYAMSFIRANKLEGNMFNYWTEGGFIAWGQEPDPNIGRTPLQLFMDGRAQAAYDRESFRLWSNIMAGGPVATRAAVSRRKLTNKDYVEIGEWVDETLKKHEAWLLMMPAGQFNSTIIKSIEKNPNWLPVFLNDKQRIYVDMTTQKGKKLFDGILTGETKYPDEYSKALALANTLIYYGNGEEAKRKGLGFAKRAFELYPSQTSMQKILFASRFLSFVDEVANFCSDYIEQFEQNRDKWKLEDGYYLKSIAAIQAYDFMARLAAKSKKKELETSYRSKIKQLGIERAEVIKGKRW